MEAINDDWVWHYHEVKPLPLRIILIPKFLAIIIYSMWPYSLIFFGIFNTSMTEAHLINADERPILSVIATMMALLFGYGVPLCMGVTSLPLLRRLPREYKGPLFIFIGLISLALPLALGYICYYIFGFSHVFVVFISSTLPVIFSMMTSFFFSYDSKLGSHTTKIDDTCDQHGHNHEKTALFVQ